MNKVRICVDTGAFGHFYRRKNAVVQLLAKADWIGISVVVIGELEAVYKGLNKETENWQKFERFTAHPLVHQLEITREVAQIYGELHKPLGPKRIVMPSNMLWIAATAIQTGSKLITYDRRYSVLSRLGSIIL